MPDWHELAVVMFLVSIDKRSQKYKPHPSPPVFPSQGLGRTWIPEGLYQVVDFTLERINDEDHQYLTYKILFRQRNFPHSVPDQNLMWSSPTPARWMRETRERERNLPTLMNPFPRVLHLRVLFASVWKLFNFRIKVPKNKILKTCESCIMCDIVWESWFLSMLLRSTQW